MTDEAMPKEGWIYPFKDERGEERTGIVTKVWPTMECANMAEVAGGQVFFVRRDSISIDQGRPAETAETIATARAVAAQICVRALPDDQFQINAERGTEGGEPLPFENEGIEQIDREFGTSVPEDDSFVEANGGRDLEETAKRSNPKDAVGSEKAPMSTMPEQVMFEVGLAMLEGATKYGRHNYRIAGVRANVYYDAARRHLGAWWEGQDIDPDSGLSHITKAIASLVVLRDAMNNDMLTDDRPPPVKDPNWMAEMNRMAKEILARIPKEKHKRPFTRADKPIRD